MSSTIAATLCKCSMQESGRLRVLSRYGVARACTELVNGHECALKTVIKRLRFPLEIMPVGVRWYVAYPLSLRNLEEMMQERGVTEHFGAATA